MAEDALEYRQELKAHRLRCLDTKSKNQNQYDASILSLSGGALGVSMIFVKDIIGHPMHAPGFLFGAWVCWALSVVAVLVSFRAAIGSIDHEIQELDAGPMANSLGGLQGRILATTNFLSGFLFFMGVLLMTCFVARNL